MENYFSTGELAKYQNISKQTLIFYDKIGLFKPSYVDPENGYRYYSVEQIDYLDTILILKKIGFSLPEIKAHMQKLNTADSLTSLHSQLSVIRSRIQELSLIENRLEHRCSQMEAAMAHTDPTPEVQWTEPTHILYADVAPPYGMREISIATKQCYAQARRDNLPVFFQSGVSVPLAHIREQRFTEAATAFLTTEDVHTVENIRTLPAGRTVSTYHFGNYYAVEGAYRRLLDYCQAHQLEIVSDSYEFCVNDYITSRYEDEFITKILFYVEKKP